MAPQRVPINRPSTALKPVVPPSLRPLRPARRPADVAHGSPSLGADVGVAVNHAGLHHGAGGWNTAWRGLAAQQIWQALGKAAVLPAPDRDLTRAYTPGEFHRAAAVGGQKHDLRLPNICG